MKKYKDNFLIMCESRTGSTMLSTALWNHPQVCMHGEILQPRQFNKQKRDDKLEFFGLSYDTPGALLDLLRDELVNDPVKYISRYGFYTGRYKRGGFKFKYEEMSCGLFDPVLEFIVTHPEIKIIHLTRDNLWHRYRSSYVATKITKQYNSVTDTISIDTDTDKVKLNIQDIESSFKRTVQWQRKYRNMFKHHAMLNITYESLLADPQGTFDQVTGFLKISNQKWKPWTKQVQPVQDDDIIRNMDKIREHFISSKYGVYFDK